MPTSPRSKTVLFQIDFGEIVTCYKGPMWASAPTDPFFDTLNALRRYDALHHRRLEGKPPYNNWYVKRKFVRLSTV